MLADGEPGWLVAWRQQQAQPPAPPAATPSPALPKPKVRYAPHDSVQFASVPGADLQGFVEPGRWDYDGCKRREPVKDADYPYRVVRTVGWQRCLKCRRPFFSEDVIRLRLCVGGAGTTGCRGDEDRFR